MAENNKNISIDIEINASGQQQINQYKAAFDSLRTSISNLSQPISKGLALAYLRPKIGKLYACQLLIQLIFCE